MCIVRERRPAGFLDMKCQTCFSSIHIPVARGYHACMQQSGNQALVLGACSLLDITSGGTKSASGVVCSQGFTHPVQLL